MASPRDFVARYIDYRTAWKAALILGAIVWLINLPHGALAALPAAAKQAAWTFVAAGFMVRLCEAVVARSGVLAGVVVPSCVAIGLVYLVHSLKGTPEPFLSTLPTIVMAPPGFFALARRKQKALDENVPANLAH